MTKFERNRGEKKKKCEQQKIKEASVSTIMLRYNINISILMRYDRFPGTRYWYQHTVSGYQLLLNFYSCLCIPNIDLTSLVVLSKFKVNCIEKTVLWNRVVTSQRPNSTSSVLHSTSSVSYVLCRRVVDDGTNANGLNCFSYPCFPLYWPGYRRSIFWISRRSILPGGKCFWYFIPVTEFNPIIMRLLRSTSRVLTQCFALLILISSQPPHTEHYMLNMWK
jgi:hypothetical protein